MRMQLNKRSNIIHFFIGSLILLSLATFAAAQKRTNRKTQPVKNQYQSLNINGATFKIPADWVKNPFNENLWEGQNGLSANISVYTLTDEDVLKAGNFSIETELQMLYENEKKYGAEDVRFLEIGGVKGVHFVRENEAVSKEDDKTYSQKSIRWVFQREYKGQRQLGNISFSAPAKTFPQNKAQFYRMLNSVKFTVDIIDQKINNARKYLESGRTHRKNGNYAQAAIDFSKGIEVAPENLVLYRLLSERASVPTRTYDEQIADYTKVIELGPKIFRTNLFIIVGTDYKFRANVYFLKGDLPKAIADYTKIIEMSDSAEPDYARKTLLFLAYRDRGASYFELKEYEKAVFDFTKAIELDAENAPYFSRGRAYAEMSEFDKAIADFTKLIELEPEAASYYRERAKIYRQKGSLALAETDERKAQQLEKK